MIMKRVVVLNLSTYKHIEYIDFPLDGDKNFCYRSRVSATYYFYSQKNRNRNKFKNVLYHIREPDTWDSPKVKVTKLNSIWDFYKHIGYDYKAQKYI